MQGARFCFYFHQVKNFDASSGIPVKLASEIWPRFKILLKTKNVLFFVVVFFFFYFCWLLFSFFFSSEDRRVGGVKKQDRP